MKAAVLYGKHDLKIEDIPVPEPGNGFRLVKVSFCGICGTDVHLYNGDEGSVKLIPGTVPGHELSGTLADTGEKVTVDPNYYCGKCSACLSQKPHYCENIFNTGVTVNGGFAEYVLAHESQIHRIPGHLKLEDASFSEPVSCCLHGINLLNLKRNDRVLITGAGPIGLIMLQIAKASGISHIAVSEPVENKRKLAVSLGADSVYNSNLITPGQLRKCSYNKIIECSGNIIAAKTAVEVCAPTGTIMFFGLTHPEDELSIKPFELFKRELTLMASYINPKTMPDAVEIISDGRIRVSPLISEIISLEQLPHYLSNASEMLKKGKVLVKFEE